MKLSRPSLSTGIFMSYFKKSTLAAIVLALGFGGGVYVAFNFDSFPLAGSRTARIKEPVINQQTAEASSLQAEQNTGVATVSANPDTNSSDSILQNPQQFDTKRLGNINSQGVVAVDVQR
jgi:hypothetical protein